MTNKHLFTFYSDNRTAREIEVTGRNRKFNSNPGPMTATSDPENVNSLVITMIKFIFIFPAQNIRIQ